MSKQILISLLNCSWQWGLLVGVTWLVTNRLRRSNATFHLLWLFSLISLPTLFGLNQFVPALSIKTGQAELTQSQPGEVSLHPLDLSAIDQARAENHTLMERIFPANFGLLNGLLCVWGGGVLIMLVRLLFGLYRIGQLRRSAVPADDSYQTVCSRLAQQMKIDRPVTVCYSDQVLSPISFGWLSPHILIPGTLSLERFKLVAAHELAHVRRLDWLINLFSHLVGAIFFFHPFYHFLSRRLAGLREQICDDWVIQLTGARKNYAQCLLDLVRHKDQSIPLALALNQPSQLESRIGSILTSNRRLDLQPKPRLLLMVATLLLTSLPLLAMAQLVPLRTVQFSLFSQAPEEVNKEEFALAREFYELKEDYEDEKITRNDVGVKLEALGITWKRGHEMLERVEKEYGRNPFADNQGDDLQELIRQVALNPVLHGAVSSGTMTGKEAEQAIEFSKLYQASRRRDLDRQEAAVWLEKLGMTWEEGEILLKKAKAASRSPLRERWIGEWGGIAIYDNRAWLWKFDSNGKKWDMTGTITGNRVLFDDGDEKWSGSFKLEDQGITVIWQGKGVERFWSPKKLAAEFSKLREGVMAKKISETEADAWLKKFGIDWAKGEELLKSVNREKVGAEDSKQ